MNSFFSDRHFGGFWSNLANNYRRLSVIDLRVSFRVVIYATGRNGEYMKGCLPKWPALFIVNKVLDRVSAWAEGSNSA